MDSGENEDLITTSEDDLQNEDLTMALEDDLFIAYPIVKDKFKELPSLITSTFNWEDENQANSDEESSSNQNKTNSEEESSSNQDKMPSFNFNVLQLDPEIFDPPFQFTKHQKNE